MKNKKIIIFIIILLIIDVYLLLYLINFNIIAFDKNFYKKEFLKYDVYSKLADKNIEEINNDVLLYLKHGNNELIENDFFNIKEKQHLLDVKNLIQGLNLFFYSLIILFVFLSIILIFLVKNRKKMIKYTSIILIGGGLLTIVDVFFFWLIVKYNFAGFFDKFHNLFFKSGTWVFDPAIDKITTLYPSGFFYDITMKIVLDTLFWALILVLVGILLLVLVYNKTTKYINKQRTTKIK